MSGDKVQKTDKASELWFRLFLNADFKKELYKLRKKKDSFAYYFQQDSLFRKYKILPTQRLRNICDQYIFGRKNAKIAGDYLPVRVQTPSESELQESKKAFLKLWIYDGVSRDEIIEYIKKKWRMIEQLLRFQNMPRVKRVRKIRNKKLIELVLKVNKLSTKELRRRCVGMNGYMTMYREDLIRHLIAQKEYHVSVETIKGIIVRYKKIETFNQA